MSFEDKTPDWHMIYNWLTEKPRSAEEVADEIHKIIDQVYEETKNYYLYGKMTRLSDEDRAAALGATYHFQDLMRYYLERAKRI